VQKRKEVHRGGWRVGVVSACVALLVGVGDEAAGSCGVSQCTVPRLNEGLAGSLHGFACSGDRTATKHRAAVLSVFSNPYMIEGLIAWDMLAECVTPSRSVRFDWHHLGHVLYREDRFEAALGLVLPVGGLRLAVIPATDRREVKGFSAAYSFSLCLAASCEYEGRACVGLVGRAYASDPDALPRSSACFMFRTGPIGFVLERAASRGGENARLALEARLTESCSIISGYRWQTGELSSVISVRVVPAMLYFSWSQHPALGSTVSAGVGRLWEW